MDGICLLLFLISVFIRWPQLQSETNWHYLGSISNAKPSAIFRVAQVDFKNFY